MAIDRRSSDGLKFHGCLRVEINGPNCVPDACVVGPMFLIAFVACTVQQGRLLVSKIVTMEP